MPPPREEAATGVLYGLAAYGTWGFLGAYFRALAAVPALEILAHRVVWSAPLLVAWLVVRGRLGEMRSAFKSPGTWLPLVATTVLIAANWLLFVIAVSTGRALEASLGYYMNPLVNVLLGRLFLGERLRPLQKLAVALATVGVAYLTASHGKVPLLSLTLAFTFGFYGLLKKKIKTDGQVGLTIETSLLFPFALGYLLWLAATGTLTFGHGPGWQTALLALSGLVTALPLAWFAQAIRRLRLSTVGLIQYVSPTIQLLLAVWVFGEAFRPVHGVTFVFLWTGLALYSFDAFQASRPRAGAEAPH
ncbi:MAG: EamA family transporter RarD [Thermoanaerobaculia bacterium]|nr:EamA family transporter RarD [Thermoanaerobaculia bacterium]